MGTQRSSQPTASQGNASKKGVTPPKGRPTRARNASGSRKRVFGPVAQWTTVAVLIALIVVVLVLVTDGGDFNPFDDEQLPSQFGAPAATLSLVA
ncbi:MAG: hypothetical protein ACLGHQ_14430 [Acidimicrobiia bacterium]